MVLTLATTILRRHDATPALRRLAVFAVALLVAQIALGASIIWTHRSVVPTTTHLVIGAALLATCWATTLRAGRSAVVAHVTRDLPHGVPA
jgi:heme A synthase